MLPLAGKPILEEIISYLKSHGVTEVALTTNYLRDKVIDHFGEKNEGVRLHYPLEPKPLGTAGSVKNIKGFLDETFIVIQGDNITDMNLTELVKFHKKKGALASIALQAVDDPEHYGVVKVNSEGRVVKFQEKPPKGEAESNLINSGLYVLEPEALDNVPEGKVFDFARDLFPILLPKKRVYAKKLSGFWVDVGQPEGYSAAKNWLLSTMQENIHPSSSVDGFVHDAVVLGKNVKVAREARILGPAFIGDDVVIHRDCIIGPGTVIGDGVEIGRGTGLYGAVVFEGTKVGLNGSLDKCFIAEDCKIGAASHIQPHSLVGPNVNFGKSVSVRRNARIWPDMHIGRGQHVHGTLRNFREAVSIKENPVWSLRTLSPDESFYFNKAESKLVSFTGFKARSLLEFREILDKVEMSSVDHHMRYNFNDFRDWALRVIGDKQLSRDFYEVKKKSRIGRGDLRVKEALIKKSEARLEQLFKEVYPK